MGRRYQWTRDEFLRHFENNAVQMSRLQRSTYYLLKQGQGAGTSNVELTSVWRERSSILSCLLFKSNLYPLSGFIVLGSICAHCPFLRQARPLVQSVLGSSVDAIHSSFCIKTELCSFLLPECRKNIMYTVLKHRHFRQRHDVTRRKTKCGLRDLNSRAHSRFVGAWKCFGGTRCYVCLSAYPAPYSSQFFV
jgi:hypothetical protein